MLLILHFCDLEILIRLKLFLPYCELELKPKLTKLRNLFSHLMFNIIMFLVSKKSC